MSDAALFEDDAFEADELFDDLDELDDAEDALDFEAADFDDLDDEGFDDDAYDLADDDFDDEFFDDDGFDAASGLYAPDTRLVTGPAAVAMMRSLQPLVLNALDSDDADAFFGNIWKGIKNVAGSVARGVGNFANKAWQGIKKVGSAVAPMLTKALPFVQNMVRMIPGWGTVASAALGGLQGLMEGKGLGGALQGALGGIIPGGGALGGIGKALGGLGGALGGKGGLGGALGGLLGGGGGGGLGGLLGGKGGLGGALGGLLGGGGGGGLGGLLSGVLGGDGADDDADLDALADYSDVKGAPHSIVHPVAAGLGSRLIFRQLLSGLTNAGVPFAQILRRLRELFPAMRNVEGTLLKAARSVTHAGGGERPGTGVRAIRHAARRALQVAAPNISSARSVPRVVSQAAKVATRQVASKAARAPRTYAKPLALSARRHRARRRILRRLPLDLVFKGYAQQLPV